MNAKIKKSIILVSGEENSGKSNTIALVYRKLLKSHVNHLFINNENREGIYSCKDEIKTAYLENNDFIAVFKFENGKVIAVISSGDDIEYFNENYERVKEYNPDMLILTERIFPRKRPIYNYINDDLAKDGFEIKLHLLTSLNAEHNLEMEETISDVILFYLNKHNFLGE